MNINKPAEEKKDPTGASFLSAPAKDAGAKPAGLFAPSADRKPEAPSTGANPGLGMFGKPAEKPPALGASNPATTPPSAPAGGAGLFGAKPADAASKPPGLSLSANPAPSLGGAPAKPLEGPAK